MVDLWVQLISLAILIGLSGFFSGLEVALVGTSKSKVMKLLSVNANGAKELHKLISNPGWMMSSVNLGNNLVNIAASALATSISLNIFGSEGLAIAIGVMTFLILVFGEITPKTYCNANSIKVALKFARILIWFSYVFYPLVKMFEFITHQVVKLLGSSLTPPPITEEELKNMVDLGLYDKAIEEDERKLVHGALKFDDTLIKSVMIPRTKMFILDSNLKLSEALSDINKNGYSRVPIYGKNRDDILGFVHVRDILVELERDRKDQKLHQIARSPQFVSEEQTISKLLTQMNKTKTHMAMVIDANGGIEGLVTLEDLLEEIVGEIEDETDTNNNEFTQLEKNVIITNGDIQIKKLNEIFGSKVLKEEYSSLNDYLHKKLKNIPKPGDKIKEKNITLYVEKVLNNKTTHVKIQRN